MIIETIEKEHRWQDWSTEIDDWRLDCALQYVYSQSWALNPGLTHLAAINIVICFSIPWHGMSPSPKRWAFYAIWCIMLKSKEIHQNCRCAKSTKKPMTQVCCKQATKIWTISRWKFPSMQMAFSSRPHYHIFYDLYFSVWKDLEEDLLVAKWEGHYSVLHGMGELWAEILRCPVRRTK